MISNLFTNVVVIDNNEIFRKNIIDFIKSESDIKVVGEFSNCEDGFDFVSSNDVDIVILDILLPKKDGLWFLEEINKNEFKKPKCIVVSAMNCDNVVRKAVEAGVSYFLTKPLENELLLKRIKQICLKKEVKNDKINDKLYQEKSIEIQITEVLNSFGITPSIMGFHYIRSAIEMAIYNTELLVGITKGIYPDIAKKYSTTPSKVERAIRHAIECIWKNGNSDIYCKTIGSISTKKPTNSQFIAILTEYFRLGIINNKSA